MSETAPPPRKVAKRAGARAGTKGRTLITAILVRTHNAGNLGAAARVVTNFGARLALVDPRVARDHPDALAYASGAEKTLDSAPGFRDVAEVSSTVDLLVALTSARGRNARGLPGRISGAAIRRALHEGQSVGLLFGPERSGLTTEEVLACDRRWSLPTEPDFPTLNLAQSVAVSLALIRGDGNRRERPEEGPGGVIRRETWRHLTGVLRRTLEGSFPVRRARPDVIDEVVQIIQRARPTQREAELLLAALASLERRRDS